MGLEVTFVGNVFGALKHYTKWSKIWIDNLVFRLHCKVTALILFASCIIVSIGQFFGDPIDCIVDGEIPEGVMDTYCWIHSTFTLPKLVSEEVGVVVPHPGVGPVPDLNYEEEIVRHTFYQWVCFVLFLQGCCFLVPSSIWKKWEGGKLAKIIPTDDLIHTHVSDTRMPGFPTGYSMMDQKKVNLAVAKMKDYFLVKSSFYTPSKYLMKFTICEVMNFLNVLLQILFMDVFFGGVFTTYGSDVLAMSQQDPDLRDDPLNRVFPKVAKCNFNKYGPSGTVEIFDGLCILSLNIINEKIYVLLWFWFVTLSTLSAIQLVWRVLSITSRGFREFMLRKQTNNMATVEHAAICCAKLTMGDWFVLMQIGDNIDVHIFTDLVKQIGMGLKKVYPSPDDQIMTAL